MTPEQLAIKNVGKQVQFSLDLYPKFASSLLIKFPNCWFIWITEQAHYC